MNTDQIDMSRNTIASATPIASRRALFTSFLKIGAFTFGGGWAMISIIEREVVDKHKWIARDEFLNLLALAQSLPGILAVNIAVAVGHKTRPHSGAPYAALGTILPSFLIILAIAIFLTPDTIKESKTLSAIFMGIRPAVVALIIAPVISSAKSAALTWRTIWIPLLVALFISLDLGLLSNPITYILLGGIGGWLHYRMSCSKMHKKQEGGRK